MELLLTIKKHLTIALWVSLRLSATTQASWNVCCRPWWDVSRSTLNLVEDILSTYKCTLAAVAQKSNDPEHMLIWPVILVSVCGIRTRSLSALFCYTLYVIVCQMDVSSYYHIMQQEGGVKFGGHPSDYTLSPCVHIANCYTLCLTSCDFADVCALEADHNGRAV